LGEVIALFAAAEGDGWTEQEKAELYRAASILAARGLPFESMSGQSDEGEPWFLLIAPESGDVLVHFARIGGGFLAHHVGADVVLRGRDMRELVDRVLGGPEQGQGRAFGDGILASAWASAAAVALTLDWGLHPFDRGEAAVSAPDAVPAEEASEPPTPVEPDATETARLDSPEDTPARPAGDVPETARDASPPPHHEPVAPAPIPDGDAGSAADGAVPGPAPSAAHDGPAALDLPAPAEAGLLLAGGDGDDSLVGSEGADTLVGGAGDDWIRGGPGDDLLVGGEGNDTIDGGTGDDSQLGGEGDDTLDGNEGDDRLHGGVGADTLEGGEGHDSLDGGAGADLLIGGPGDDTLRGADGEDSLFGAEGNDLLIAGPGTDLLVGGAGRNVFQFVEGTVRAIAGEGEDIFVYDEADATRLTIAGFDPEMDRVLWVDAAGATTELSAFLPDPDGIALLEAASGGWIRLEGLALADPVT